MAHPHQQQIRNQWDLIVTSSSVECVSLLDEFVIEFLAYGKHGGRIIHSAINADRSCLLAQVFAAALYNFGETHDTRQSRDKFLQTARTIAQCDADTSTGSRLLDKRQLLWLDAVTCWRDAQSDRAIQHLTAIIADYPRDLFAVCQTASTHTHTKRERSADLAIHDWRIRSSCAKSCTSCWAIPRTNCSCCRACSMAAIPTSRMSLACTHSLLWKTININKPSMYVARARCFGLRIVD
jgi:hypothetical protein